MAWFCLDMTAGEIMFRRGCFNIYFLQFSAAHETILSFLRKPVTQQSSVEQGVYLHNSFFAFAIVGLLLFGKQE